MDASARPLKKLVPHEGLQVSVKPSEHADILASSSTQTCTDTATGGSFNVSTGREGAVPETGGWEIGANG